MINLMLVKVYFYLRQNMSFNNMQYQKRPNFVQF